MSQLNTYAGALNLLFTAVVALSTVVYAVLTWRLVAETRLMRRAQTTPKIAVFYRNSETAISLLDIVIENIGLGPAYELQFELQPITSGDGTEKLLADLTERNVFATGLKFLAPGQTFSCFFTNLLEGFDGKITSQIRVIARYRGTAGVKHEDEYILDLSEIRGLIRVGEPPLLKISKDIEKMATALASFGSGNRRLKADVYTAADRAEERKRRDEWIEGERKKTEAAKNQS
jgi:hypothetical protein